jgi:hypothetical protein
MLVFLTMVLKTLILRIPIAPNEATFETKIQFLRSIVLYKVSYMAFYLLWNDLTNAADDAWG